MRYRAYGGPQGSGPINPVDKARMPFREFDTLDEALMWARRIIEAGHSAQLIEGDDGTRLSKEDIAAAIRHPDVRGPNSRPGVGPVA